MAPSRSRSRSRRRHRSESSDDDSFKGRKKRSPEGRSRVSKHRSQSPQKNDKRPSKHDEWHPKDRPDERRFKEGRDPEKEATIEKRLRQIS